jgi:hypothetical protein
VNVVMRRGPMFNTNGTCHGSAALAAQNPTTLFCALRATSEVVKQPHHLGHLHNAYVKHTQ